LALLLAILFAGALPGGGALFDGPRFDAQPGAWVEYLVRTKGSEPLRVRVSVLSKEGENASIEIDTLAKDKPPQSVRMLVHGSPADARNVDKLELYVAGQAPIEVPLDDLRDDLRPPPKSKARAVERGRERVQVQAGSFDAVVVDRGGARIWSSNDVPIFGMVKTRTQAQTAELIAFGRTGAHSLFPDAAHQNGSETTK
jgi:hypothetical protein